MLKTAKVVGLNSDAQAAQAFISGTTLFAVVSCACDDAFSRTRQALYEAENSFTTSTSPTSQRLEEAAVLIKKSLEDTDDVNILLASTQEDENAVRSLYLLYQGELVAAYLFRGGEVVKLSDMAGDNQLISGFIQEGDRILLTTLSLVEIVKGDLKQLSRPSLDSLEDEVMGQVDPHQVNPVAAVFLEEEVLEKAESPVEELDKTEKVIRPELGQLIARFKVPSKRIVVILGVIVLLLIGGTVGLILKSKKATDNQTTSSATSQPVVESSSPEILKTYSVVELPLWLDLELIKKGLTAEKLSLSSGNILILDPQSSTLVTVGLSSKSNQILAGQKELGEAKLAALGGKVAAVFSDKGVVRVDTTNQESTVAVKKDDNWGKITAISTFSGNVYLLDEGSTETTGQIWKYVPLASGYSDKIAYFKEGTKASLVGAKKMQIDSSLWILTQEGGIEKFTSGVADKFDIVGLDKPLVTPKSFFVSEETENVYILDSGNNRLVVLDKKGGYQAQYQSDSLGGIIDFVADEEGKKVYLLDGSKILMMELK